MSKKDKELPANQWFLRTGADAEFGPVEKQGLLLWAEQARILPGHEVSSDRKSWKPAVSVAFLDMCWFIDDGDGDLKGPLNRTAAETLIKNGKFSKKARIVSAIEASEGGVKEDSPKEKEKEREKEKKTPAKQNQSTIVGSNASVTIQAESQLIISELNKKNKVQAERLRRFEAEHKKVDASSVSDESHQKLKQENDVMQCELVATRKQLENLHSDVQSRNKQIEMLERKLNEKRELLGKNKRKIEEAVQIRERALQQSRESERSFARLLSDANKRDIDYKAKIDALKKNISLSPDQTDKFYSDQSAIYQILKRELDNLIKTMDGEREHFESLKTLELERLNDLEKRRQTLQNHIGNSPVEMTNRVLREQTTDPNAVRLRSQFDNLKIAHERSTHRFQERERELIYKLKVVQSDYSKLMNEMLEKERVGELLQEVRDQLTTAEYELNELRKSYDAERKQFVANNNALTARVVELESGGSAANSAAAQSSEAKNVKLASWMTFRK